MSKSVVLAFISIMAFSSGTVYAATGEENASSGLDAVEASHLTFMREEEKLARDVYLTFAEQYPAQDVFNTIATHSEQTHTDTMRDKLSLYNLPDPNPDTNNLPYSIGHFYGEEWGAYFTEKFQQLTEKGDAGSGLRYSN